MTDKYEALKAAALAASRGQWTYQDVPGAGLQIRVPYQDSTRLVFSDIWRPFPEKVWDAQMVCNAAYVEAASPDVVLALITERDTLATKVKQMEAQEPVCLIPDYELDYMQTNSCGAVYKVGTDEALHNDADIKLFLAPGANPDKQDAPKADMFWNADDAEQLYSCIEEFLNDEICNGSPLEVGDIRTIQSAVRLPNIDIRITSINDEECEAEYEVIDAAIEGAK